MDPQNYIKCLLSNGSYTLKQDVSDENSLRCGDGDSRRQEDAQPKKIQQPEDLRNRSCIQEHRWSAPSKQRRLRQTLDSDQQRQRVYQNQINPTYVRPDDVSAAFPNGDNGWLFSLPYSTTTRKWIGYKQWMRRMSTWTKKIKNLFLSSRQSERMQRRTEVKRR